MELSKILSSERMDGARGAGKNIRRMVLCQAMWRGDFNVLKNNAKIIHKITLNFYAKVPL